MAWRKRLVRCTCVADTILTGIRTERRRVVILYDPGCDYILHRLAAELPLGPEESS